MFVLSENPRFTHAVKVMTPVDGGHKVEEFKATFTVIDVNDIGDTSSLPGQTELLRRVVVGLEDIVDDAKKPVPYSDEFRDRLIGIPYIRAGLVQTYLAAVIKSAVGN
jgi:hypothetical protein